MDFVDKTLLRLASPTTRAALFDETSLEQLLAAAYDVEALNVEGPYSPLFDEFRLGFTVRNFAVAEGSWSVVGSIEKVEARFHLYGLGEPPPVRIDGLWRGAVVARTSPATSRVTRVEVSWPTTADIDAEIEGALGALPTDPVVLEQERRARFLARIRGGLDQPAALTDGLFDEWLGRIGASSVGDLMTNFRGVVQGGALQLEFSAPVVAPASPKPLPLTAALLIREANFSVAQLLSESKATRELLTQSGVENPGDGSLRPREPLVVVWLIPLTVFDDPEWPGATGGMSPVAARDARRAAAGRWLAREGIGLVPVI